MFPSNMDSPPVPSPAAKPTPLEPDASVRSWLQRIFSPPRIAPRDLAGLDLAAESITVKIRWFGLCVGYVLVNFLPRGVAQSQAAMNAILTLGAVYALVDTFWSLRGEVFLRRWPLIISAMEAVFIGLLCKFDQGLDSPFRFYYFLSLLVCAIRHSPLITLLTFTLHSLSYISLSVGETRTAENFSTLLLMLVLMGWATWAGTALSGLLKAASRRFLQLNSQLQENQTLLEMRIAERTRELQESQALLVQQEKQAAFGLLAAGIAHEVGNPLAAISSLVQMLQRRPNDDYTKERLQMVDDQLRRIQRTLRELVDFSRPATSLRSLCDLHQLIDAALNIAKYYKRTKGKKIEVRYAPNLPGIRVVRDQLVQVFLNLILNAMDATEEGGTIEISSSCGPNGLCMTIRDDGHGIRPADLPRVFQPYFTTKETGTGLGLFVCHRIMEQAGGRIELCESSSAGTIFAVTIPSEGPCPEPCELMETVVLNA